MKSREFKQDDGVVRVRAEIRDSILKAEVDGQILEGPLLRTSMGAGLWRVGSRAYRVVAAEQNTRIWASVNGRVYVFEKPGDDDFGAASGAENSVTAPMPGKVIKVMVKAGDEVEEGQPVLIVEAMKMEHTLRAPKAGRVAALKCEEGQQVDASVPLVEFEEEA